MSSGQPHKPAYRTDLQGLRAIAVVMVLLFHFELLGATGGFAGVDVFFVLSGYLMTAILASHADTPPWQLLSGFWKRRIWRLAPASSVVISITFITACIFLTPFDLEKLGRAAATAIIFASNFYFAGQAGYFAESAIYKPLLHTWSLGVEMQFYLVWPIAYLCIRRLSDGAQTVCLLISIVVGYALAELLYPTNSEQVFFHSPYRLWQFGIGALLANAAMQPFLRMRLWSAQPTQFGAIVALLYCTFFLSEDVAWPIKWGLVPTLATAVLIAGNMENRNRDALVPRLLSKRVMTGLGDISYSLYLVHWPIACFTYYYFSPEWPVWIRIAGLTSSFPLAWLLYRFVEIPLRTGWKTPQWTRPQLSFAMLNLIVLVAAYVAWSTNGLPQRFSATTQAALSTLQSDLPPECGPGLLCGDRPENAGTILLWGDSHARHFSQALQEASAQSGFDVRLAIGSGCISGFSVAIINSKSGFKEECIKVGRGAMDKIANDRTIKAVFLANRWSFYVNGFDPSVGTQSQRFIVKKSDTTYSKARSQQNIVEELQAIIEATDKRNIPLILLGQVPDLKTSPIRCLQSAIIHKTNTSACSISREFHNEISATYTELLAGLASNAPNTSFIPMTDIFCNERTCRPTLDGKLAYSDGDHLTIIGARKALDGLNFKSIVLDTLN